MAVGNVELMHECFPKHLRKRTARMIQSYKTKKQKKKDVSRERSKAGTKKLSPGGLSLPNQNTMMINIIWQYFIKY